MGERSVAGIARTVAVHSTTPALFFATPLPLSGCLPHHLAQSPSLRSH